MNLLFPSVWRKMQHQEEEEDNDKLHAMQCWSSPFPLGDPINCGPDKSLSRKHYYWLPAACLSVCLCLTDLAMTHSNLTQNSWRNSLPLHFLIEQTWQSTCLKKKVQKNPADRKQKDNVGLTAPKNILSTDWKVDNPGLLDVYSRQAILH